MKPLLVIDPERLSLAELYAMERDGFDVAREIQLRPKPTRPEHFAYLPVGAAEKSNQWMR